MEVNRGTKLTQGTEGNLPTQAQLSAVPMQFWGTQMGYRCNFGVLKWGTDAILGYSNGVQGTEREHF